MWEEGKDALVGVKKGEGDWLNGWLSESWQDWKKCEGWR